MTLAILMPSRGRPGNLERFLKETMETAEDWRVYVRLDNDDLAMQDYLRLISGYSKEYVPVVFGDRVGFGASLNELAHEADQDGMTHLGMFGDDVVPVTLGWDTRLVDALGDDLGVSYGDDGLRHLHSPDLPTHYVTQTEVYRRLGYLSPPGIRHLFLDNVARDVGRHLGNFQYVPVVIKHLHPWAEGEDLNDATYAEGGRNPRIRKNDRETYLRWSRDRTWRKRLS